MCLHFCAKALTPRASQCGADREGTDLISGAYWYFNPAPGRVAKGMLDMFVKKMYGEGTTTRLRPSYFPFTEPSVEVDVSCFECGGKGCKLREGTGWSEILGAGIVNKKVLENCGIDSEEYSGLAFGIGIERVAMLKYGIDNIKLLFESDLRVLRQIDDN